MFLKDLYNVIDSRWKSGPPHEGKGIEGDEGDAEGVSDLVQVVRYLCMSPRRNMIIHNTTTLFLPFRTFGTAGMLKEAGRPHAGKRYGQGNWLFPPHPSPTPQEEDGGRKANISDVFERVFLGGKVVTKV